MAATYEQLAEMRHLGARSRSSCNVVLKNNWGRPRPGHLTNLVAINILSLGGIRRAV
jgi:hypothetical protein